MKTAMAIPLALGTALFSGCSEEGMRGAKDAGSSRPAVSVKETPEAPSAVRPILAAIRRGDAIAADAAHQALMERETLRVFKGWLSRVLVKGHTTLDEVISSFGRHYHNLDRPRRDDVVCIEYSLGSPTNFTMLVLDFDRGTRRLTDWSISQGICGYCPHVFADDGRWRLEGKMLAGCIGPNREGTDVLPLPRLVRREDRLRVRVSNLASEVEYIDQIRLGSVPLAEGEQLDAGVDGRAFVWSSTAEIRPGKNRTAGEDEFKVNWDEASRPHLLVAEVRNTATFETLMRGVELQGKPRIAAELRVRVGDSPAIDLKPVGTKFLRRIVVPVPRGAHSATLISPTELWLVPRVWICAGRAVDSEVTWRSPEETMDSMSSLVRILADTDRDRLHLEPMQGVDLEFRSNAASATANRVGYLLKMRGYYEFILGPRDRVGDDLP